MPGQARLNMSGLYLRLMRLVKESINAFFAAKINIYGNGNKYI